MDEPGIALTGDISLGKYLQVPSFILLAEPAPAKGLDITLTLTSSDPKALVLSANDDKLGTGTLKIHVAAGEMRIPYYIQGLAESGFGDAYGFGSWIPEPGCTGVYGSFRIHGGLFAIWSAG